MEINPNLEKIIRKFHNAIEENSEVDQHIRELISKGASDLTVVAKQEKEAIEELENLIDFFENLENAMNESFLQGKLLSLEAKKALTKLTKEVKNDMEDWSKDINSA